MQCRIPVALLALLLAGCGSAIADALPCAPAESARAVEGRPNAEAAPTAKRFAGDRFARTELYFGSARPGGEVSEAEFQQFLDECVTPRFPDGLTLLTGLGQFRGASGVVQERSMLLILLYPDEARRDSSRKIEEIREAYQRIFQQESVLRADRCCEQVGF